MHLLVQLVVIVAACSLPRKEEPSSAETRLVEEPATPRLPSTPARDLPDLKVSTYMLKVHLPSGALGAKYKPIDEAKIVGSSIWSYLNGIAYPLLDGVEHFSWTGGTDFSRFEEGNVAYHRYTRSYRGLESWETCLLFILRVPLLGDERTRPRLEVVNQLADEHLMWSFPPWDGPHRFLPLEAPDEFSTNPAVEPPWLYRIDAVIRDEASYFILGKESSFGLGREQFCF